jgi:cation:H+ antiporter
VPVYLIALLVGLVLLVLGAELLVRGGGRLALALRVPALVVGLTVVAFGTSTPELAVSLTAAFRGNADMALANVTGSNIANIALVLGLAALVSPLKVERSLIRREVPVALFLQALVPFMCLDGEISRLEGLILFVLGAAYNAWLVGDAIRSRPTLAESDLDLEEGGDLRWNVVLLVAGIVVLLVGAQFFVSGAVDVAHRLGLSDRFIGLTVVALGTSAPELATGVVSAYRGESDLAMGNSVGSNILNITIVLAATAIVRPIVVQDRHAILDGCMALLVTLLLIPMVMRGREVSRPEGALMAAGYVLYLVLSP